MRSPLLRRPVIAWALCDWANSAFATTVMAGFFPVFFKQYWSAGTEAAVSTFQLGLANGIGSLVIALIAPLLGAMADRGGARVRMLAFFTLLGALMTALLYQVGQGQWAVAGLIYLVAGIGFSGGVIFNDALLVDVSQPREYDLVSAYGYSLGYAGGGLLLLVNAAMVANPAGFGLADAGEAVRIAFPMVAAWWLLFTVPALLWVREQKPARPLALPAAAVAGFRELRATIAEVRRYRPLLWFLLAYWMYIDGVNTIIKMAVDYGLSLGFPQQSLIAALLITQFVAFPAALAFGWIGSRIGARNGIFIAIAIYSRRDGRRLLDAGDHAFLPARGHHRAGAGWHPVAVALLFRLAGAGGQAGRVLRLLQHDGQVRRGARADDGRRHGAGHQRHALRHAVDHRAVRGRRLAALARASGPRGLRATGDSRSPAPSPGRFCRDSALPPARAGARRSAGDGMPRRAART